jgi:penicillin-binding protein 2
LNNDRLTFKDHHTESRIFTGRLLFCVAVVLVLTGVLLGRMVWLQWAEHERYRALSDENRIQTRAITPPRGLILDRDGRVLAENRPTFSVTLVPEQIKDMEATLAALRDRIELEDQDLERFRARLDSPRRPREPVPLRSRLTEAEIARLVVTRHEHPGVRVEAEAIRHYPHEQLMSHVVGYVNRINAEDLRRMSQAERARYAGTHFYGRTGLESFYQDRLHGRPGSRQVETNARGRTLRVVSETAPQAGEDLRLALDLEVQKAAWRALGERRGAVVAMDPRDGGVLAFVSRPGFDPNRFVTGISHDRYQAYRENLDKPLFNRAARGQYPPGSTIKPFIGLAGLEHDVTDWGYTIYDPGYFSLENDPHRYRCWKREGHGKVDLHKAVVVSCDTYYYEMGFNLGIQRMHDFLARFSLGQPTHIDLPGESAGILPSKEWKKRARGASWYHGDTVNASIGQGFMLSTPLQLAQATTFFARHGDPTVPHLAAQPHREPALEELQLDQPRNWERMGQAMEDVVHGLRGTARVVGRNAKYRIAGKTGTSQVVSIPQGEEYDEAEIAERLRDHALFVAYAPAEDPAIAVAVLVENGSHGGSTAGPVARATMDAWLLDDNGELAIPSAMGAQ